MLKFEGKEFGLGVVNPRTDRVETPEEVKAQSSGRSSFIPSRRSL